jgi:hypothetical protein
MDGPYDRITYLHEHPVRAEVALACRDAPATRAEIAKRLDREPGSLTAIETLERKGVLRRLHSRRGGTRKTAQWHLEPDWREAAEAAIEGVKVGILSADLDLILVPASDVAAASELFSEPNPRVAWGAPLRGEQLGLMLCPASGEASALQLLAELSRRGVRPLRLHLPKVLDIAGEPRLVSGD